jgi:glycosidase
MPWKEIEQGKYDDRIKIMKKLISLRNKYPAFRSNQYKFIRSKNDRVIIYERYSKNCKTRTVIINCSDIPYKLTKDKPIFKYGKKENLLMPGGVVIY